MACHSLGQTRARSTSELLVARVWTLARGVRHTDALVQLTGQGMPCCIPCMGRPCGMTCSSLVCFSLLDLHLMPGLSMIVLSLLPWHVHANSLSQCAHTWLTVAYSCFRVIRPPVNLISSSYIAPCSNRTTDSIVLQSIHLRLFSESCTQCHSTAGVAVSPSIGILGVRI